MTQEKAQSPSRQGISPNLILASLLGVVLIWSNWMSLTSMAERWARDARYSHGFLVPLFSAFLLWHRRRMLATPGTAKGAWWGLLLVLVGETVKLAGSYIYLGWLESVSLLPSLAGLCLILGGRSALHYALPSIAFLIFMIPLPYRLEQAFGSQLQRIATVSSNYLLQTMGLPAVAEGNIILLGESKIGVVDACNGMGMLFTFFAFAVAVVLLVRRAWPEKVVIVLSAIPIAMLANILRISVTALLHETVGGKVADMVYHDLAGWLMMPLALAAFWFELALLSRLLLEVHDERPDARTFLQDAGIGAAHDERDMRGLRQA